MHACIPWAWMNDYFGLLMIRVDFVYNAKNLLWNKNTRKIKEVQVVSRYAPMANLQHLQSLSVKKKSFPNTFNFWLLICPSTKGYIFYALKFFGSNVFFPTRPWADPKNIINGGTWAPYKWPKIKPYRSYFTPFITGRAHNLWRHLLRARYWSLTETIRFRPSICRPQPHLRLKVPL